ncbi:MAG: TetR/AcrR family transcriptional regulator [Oscillospiraceae bacterium]|nr:TetR/AcrR family transcriptional regulator [Oscillospiraceae bacterium]
MAYGTYDETHQRILDSGLEMFLENGFERTNLRDLCAKAGVTTGSFYRHFESKEDIFSIFVQPAVDEIKKDFADAEPVCREAVEAGDIRRLWMIMDADRLLDYIYRNFDALKLLLKCSDGTKYSDFLNEVVCLETDISLRSLGMAKERGFISVELPSETEMHMICHAYISSVFEAVWHDLGREEMEKYIHTIVTFFTAGAYQVLGL